MKRAIWILAMGLMSVALMIPVGAARAQSCHDVECHLSLDCGVVCGACDNPVPILPGNCTP